MTEKSISKVGYFFIDFSLMLQLCHSAIFSQSKLSHLAKDQPEINHLGVGGEGQLLHHADEDGRHHQHVGQVHSEGGLKEERLEEGGGKGDHHEEEGWEVGG